jgi:hypothetical protein
VLDDDTEGRYPEFMQWFDSLLARATNYLRHRTDRFWDGQQASAPEVVGAETILDRACYVLGNPVKDGLVEHGRDWPGYRSTPQACTKPPEVVSRPSWFFDEGPTGRMPETAELAYHVPREHAHLGSEGWAKLFSEHLAAFEEQARKDIAAQGRTFLGPEGVRRQHWTTKPKRREPRGPKHVLHPIVISRDARARLEVIVRHKDFELDHELARLALLEGDRDVTFPFGTYQHVRLLGQRCHPPP